MFQKTQHILQPLIKTRKISGIWENWKGNIPEGWKEGKTGSVLVVERKIDWWRKDKNGTREGIEDIEGKNMKTGYDKMQKKNSALLEKLKINYSSVGLHMIYIYIYI